MIKGCCHSLSHAKPPKPETTWFGTWNMGTLTGRSGEIAEVLERRRIKVLKYDGKETGQGAKNSSRREI